MAIREPSRNRFHQPADLGGRGGRRRSLARYLWCNARRLVAL